MGPLEPKAISLCFFSKLVFQGRVGACPAHCALLCLSVLRAGSALGGFAQVKPLNWLQGSQFLFVLQGQSPCSRLLLLGLPCPAAKLCPSPQIMRFSSLGGATELLPKALQEEWDLAVGSAPGNSGLMGHV